METVIKCPDSLISVAVQVTVKLLLDLSQKCAHQSIVELLTLIPACILYRIQHDMIFKEKGEAESVKFTDLLLIMIEVLNCRRNQILFGGDM